MFGPVLHVLRFRRDALDELVDGDQRRRLRPDLGMHTRIDETIARVVERIEAGNIYVNRNVVGATVGVQPFGGQALGHGSEGGRSAVSFAAGRGAGDGRLAGEDGAGAAPTASAPTAPGWPGAAIAGGRSSVGMMARSALGARAELQGPVGERNVYALWPARAHRSGRGRRSGLLPDRRDARRRQPRSGREAQAERALGVRPTWSAWDPALLARGHVRLLANPTTAECEAVLFEGDGADALRHTGWACLPSGTSPIVPFHAVPKGALAAGRAEVKNLAWLLAEGRAVSTNTAAAGGNASLMTIG